MRKLHIHILKGAYLESDKKYGYVSFILFPILIIIEFPFENIFCVKVNTNFQIFVNEFGLKSNEKLSQIYGADGLCDCIRLI